jgi:predicted HicB family RNase H-like nuclease
MADKLVAIDEELHTKLKLLAVKKKKSLKSLLKEVIESHLKDELVV